MAFSQTSAYAYMYDHSRRWDIFARAQFRRSMRQSEEVERSIDGMSIDQLHKLAQLIRDESDKVRISPEERRAQITRLREASLTTNAFSSSSLQDSASQKCPETDLAPELSQPALLPQPTEPQSDDQLAPQFENDE